MKTFFISLILLSVSLLTSCTRLIVLQAFNHTGQRLEVVSYEANQREKHYDIDVDDSQRVQISNRLTIKTGGKTWQYDIAAVPKTHDFMASERFGALIIKMQVEPDGSIYVLSPQATNIMTKLPPQPVGYPLTPKG